MRRSSPNNDSSGLFSPLDRDAHELEEFHLKLSDAYDHIEASQHTLLKCARTVKVYHLDCREIAISYGRLVAAFLLRRKDMEHAAVLKTKQLLNRLEKLSMVLFQKCSKNNVLPMKALDEEIGRIFEELETCSHQLQAVKDIDRTPSLRGLDSAVNETEGSSSSSSERLPLPVLEAQLLFADPTHDRDEKFASNLLAELYFESEINQNVPNVSSEVMLVDPNTSKLKKGGFGVVRRILLTGLRRAAAKSLKTRECMDKQVSEQSMSSEKLPRRFLSEVSVWCSLHHKNILELLGVAECPEQCLPLSMISPWMANGNVMEYLKDNPSFDRLQFIHGVTEGIQFLHSKGIVHGDIKGMNILVSDELEALLCDFGLAKFCADYDGQNVSTTLRYAGSVRYMAIELLWEGATKTTNGSDMWAFGMTCIEILTSKVPYFGDTDAAVVINVYNKSFPSRPSNCPGDLWTFIMRCWAEAVESRPSSQEAANLLWKILHSSKIAPLPVVNHPLA